VQAAPESNDSTGDGTTVAENPPATDGAAPSTATDSFSPVPDDGDLVASTDDPSDDGGDFPGASGGTDNTVDSGATGETVRVDGPQATINKDPNGRPGDVELPDRNGPRNTSPPHGSDDDDRDRADGDRDEPQNARQRAWAKDRAKNDRQKSWSKNRPRPQNERQRSWAKAKQAENDKSKNKSPDRSKPVEPSSPGKSNDGDSDRDHRSSRDGDRDDPEPEDRNDRHDTRRDSDEDDGRDDDDDDDRDDDSDHGDDDSRGHSRSRGHRP
jgi:hypothetical protein